MNSIDVYNVHKNQLRGTPHTVPGKFNGRSRNLTATLPTLLEMELPETSRTPRRSHEIGHLRVRRSGNLQLALRLRPEHGCRVTTPRRATSESVPGRRAEDKNARNT